MKKTCLRIKAVIIGNGYVTFTDKYNFTASRKYLCILNCENNKIFTSYYGIKSTNTYSKKGQRI